MARAQTNPTPQKAQVAFTTFENVDLRVARVAEAPLADGTRYPCRVLKLDVGHLGMRVSVGQYALVGESELVGSNVAVCINLGRRKMGPYISEALVLGAPHPGSPEGQSQALPLQVAAAAAPGDPIF